MHSILSQLIEDERAVSPVIGVILMVAITVILAAVIGTFVLDLGQSAGNSAPQASLSVDTNVNANNITIEHAGGDGLDSSQTRIVVEVAGTSSTLDETSDSTVFSVGNTATVNLSDSNSGAEIVDWNGDGSEDYNSTSDNISNPLAKGDQVTVKLIDVESQRVIFETEVTA